ncbi:hypothetical protein DL767_003328 [Monosporascus sp. MG133]|nr:hypothetical protein DL767_003328 [Monosporascus sp. MG133]
MPRVCMNYISIEVGYEKSMASSVTGHRLLLPSPAGATGGPLVICFHGSGEPCLSSWDKLAALLVSHGLPVLLYERGPLNPKPKEATAGLYAYLAKENLAGPYILIAHSYGGAFARTFLHRHGAAADIAGVVLVETGQEGGLDPKVEEAQYAKRVLGSKPLSVVRGNSFLGQWRALEAAEANASHADLRLRREMLQKYDGEDERLKKKQLALSRNARYVHIPDCGHHAVRDRPDVVAMEVQWVLQNLRDGRRNREGKRKFWRRIMPRLCGRPGT